MRVLYLTHRLPYAPNRGDRVRAFHTLKLLASRADVELLSLVHDGAEASQAGVLQDLATVGNISTATFSRNSRSRAASAG